MINWRSEKRKISDLKPAPYNPRSWNEKETKNLTESLERFNLADPIIINTNNTIIGGHFRLHILKGRGATHVDVRVPDRELTEAEEKELNLRLNKNSGLWDWSMLSEYDHDTLLMVGFTEEDLMLNFGLNNADKVEVDADRVLVITVEAPEAPRLKVRQSFYCDSMDQFDQIKKHFKTKNDGKLNLKRILEMIEAGR